VESGRRLLAGSRANTLEWLHDNELYSFTGATKEVLYELTGRDRDNPLSGYDYWTHPEFDYEQLYELRQRGVTAPERKKS
jgi:hypothetical protein